MSIPGNIISGQVSGETSKQLSERFEKILQSKSSLSINSSDTSVNRSLQLDVHLKPIQFVERDSIKQYRSIFC